MEAQTYIQYSNTNLSVFEQLMYELEIFHSCADHNRNGADTGFQQRIEYRYVRQSMSNIFPWWS
jgi:hypothetical protein